MRRALCLGLVVLAAVCTNCSHAGAPSPAVPTLPDASTLDAVTRDALSEDPGTAGSGIERLRELGPPGLGELLARANARGAVAALAGKPTPGNLSAAEVLRWQRAIDGVARQRDAHTSGLYWYTDLDRALAAAKREGRPVLSLRLLGNLDEEQSCANSRFFRTALYANAELSKYLREHYVLHWKSVRPAPKITIDFGDGRKLERTITGNSIHYVLDENGRVIDALPGLYAPRTFARAVQTAEGVASRLRALDADAAIAALRFHQSGTSDLLRSAWRSDLLALGIVVPPKYVPAARANGLPSAAAAAPAAIGKLAVEAPLVRAVTPSAKELGEKTVDPLWKKIGARRRSETELDAASRALMIRKTQVELDAASAQPKPLGPEAFARLVDKFEIAIAEDTARNDFAFRSAILEWLAASAEPLALETLNQRVYSELFLTPDADRWLGLVEPDVFTGLPNQGFYVGRH